MEYTLVIEGTLPGLNEYSAEERKLSGARAAARLKRATQDLIGLYIKAQLGGIKILDPVRISYMWFEPNRRRDLDNIAFAHKFIQDALVETGVLQGDGWKHVTGFTDTFALDKTRPRVVVRLIEQ